MSQMSVFLVAHGLTIIFAIVLGERMGLPVPALPWLLGAGALSAAGKFHPFLGMGAAVLGGVLGDSFWYYLGRHRGAQVMGWLCRIALEPDSCVRRTQNVFTRYGLRGLFLAQFVPGLGTVVPPMAGLAGVPYGRFLLVDAAGSLAYAACGIGLGFFFSGQLAQIVAALEHVGGSALVLLLVTALLYVAYKFWQRQRLLRELRAARITVAELRAQIEAGKNPIIFDLRSSAELKLNPTVIRGAIHVDMDSLVSRSGEIPRDRDVVVYCSCPNEITSARLARLLQKRGFTRIRPLLGGVEAWRRLDYPMEAWSAATVTVSANAVQQ